MRKLLSPLLSLALICLVSVYAFASDSGVENSAATLESPGTDETGDAFLTTLFAQNNNFAGNSFDIEALTPLTVVGFDINLAANLSTYTIDVWTRVGTANGFEQNASGWTLLGSEVVTPAGSDLPTHVNVGGLFIDTGEIYGTIITAQEAISGIGGFCYTNGGPETYENSDMAITTYRGLSDGFPPPNTYEFRIWNGTVHYDYETSLSNSTWGNIKIEF